MSDILNNAHIIAEQYQAQGLKLTVRQMYYQFVARGLMPSGQREYKKIVNALTKARYSGRFGLDLIEDRTRTVHQGKFTRNDDDIDAALNQASDWVREMPSFFLARDRWYNQPVHVSVWVEKEALAGIFEPVCNQLGVSWLACKGCPSVSALWDWVKTANNAHNYHAHPLRYAYPNMPVVTENHDGGAERCVILYFGDHDPTGFMIPRAAQDGVNKLMAVSGNHMDIRVKRVALNMDQILQHNPPPFWAKTSDTRYRGYVEEHDTEEAWELDALDPAMLRTLIQDEVDALFDYHIFETAQAEIDDARDEMGEMMRESGWLVGTLGGEE